MQSNTRKKIQTTDMLERAIYAEICSHDGILAKDIGKRIAADRKTINQYLYKAPFIKELCYQDSAFQWHGYIRQGQPHTGLRDFCGYYSSVQDFLQLTEEEWFDAMLSGCKDIGRNLNDTRGLFHSFKDCRAVMVQLFADLEDVYQPDWEIAFELRINRAKYIRIFADVLVLTRAEDLYTHEPLGKSDALVPVCSGDMLFNLFDEYMGFLEE